MKLPSCTNRLRIGDRVEFSYRLYGGGIRISTPHPVIGYFQLRDYPDIRPVPIVGIYEEHTQLAAYYPRSLFSENTLPLPKMPFCIPIHSDFITNPIVRIRKVKPKKPDIGFGKYTFDYHR